MNEILCRDRDIFHTFQKMASPELNGTQSMKILLFGAGGQLGSEWNRYLQAIHPPVSYKGYGSDDLDITDAGRLKETFLNEKPDLVINCAAYTRVDQAEDEPDKAMLVNARAVASVAGLCTEWNAKLIHYSTDYVFPGREEDYRQFPRGYPEDYPAEPVNVYGQTKWEGEEAIRKAGCRHLIVRVSWLCGRYGNNFVKTMLRLAEERSALDVVNDQWGSPAFADNVIKNSYNLIEEEAEGTYHLTSEGLLTWADFAKAIFKFAGKQVRVRQVDSDSFPVKARRPHYSKLNTAKIKQVPGSELEDWKTGLERLIEKLGNR